jgi:hypothetical protein
MFPGASTIFTFKHFHDANVVDVDFAPAESLKCRNKFKNEPFNSASTTWEMRFFSFVTEQACRRREKFNRLK